MSNKYLDYGSEYNITPNTDGGGVFKEDIGAPSPTWDDTSTHSVQNVAIANELKANYVTIEDVTGSYPPTTPLSNRLYRDGDDLYWYDDSTPEWIKLSAINDPYCIVKLTTDQAPYIDLTNQYFKGKVPNVASLPSPIPAAGTLYNVEDVETVYKSAGASWIATTIPYEDIRSDCFYRVENRDNVYYYMPSGKIWYSIFDGTGTGEANVIEAIAVDGTNLPITSKVADASTLANKIEHIKVSGTEVVPDSTKTVNLETGEANKIDKITFNGNEVPIASKTAAITCDLSDYENVIEVIKVDGTAVSVTDKVANITSMGEENKIENIYLNDVLQPPDTTKSVHLTTSSFVNVDRGITLDSSKIGHALANAISPETTETFKTTKLDTYGHALSYTTKTFGNGIVDNSNVIGHNNSITAAASESAYKIKYDQYGHIISATELTDVELEFTMADGTKVTHTFYVS